MKVYVVFFAFAVLGYVAVYGRGVSSKNRDDDWEGFKNKFTKNYNDQDEENNRRKIWEEKMDRIDKHNEEYNNKKHKFRVGMNKFSDMSPEELKSLRGYKDPFKPKPTEEYHQADGLIGLLPFDLTDANPETQKSSVNWVEEGLVTSVKDQGACGGCWSFASAGALEAIYKKESGNLVSLSEQNLIDCSTSEGNDGCDGGAFVWAFEYVLKKGIETFDSYPFIGKNGPCEYDPSKAVTKIKGYVMVPQGSEEDLRMAVSAIGPVPVSIDASLESFNMYQDGIYDDPKCSSENIDHGVLAVGYGSEDGEDYWLIKNSWGTDWGLNGYIKMARNDNNLCGIATQAAYAVA